jgi:Ca-activated chloride channel family protein
MQSLNHLARPLILVLMLAVAGVVVGASVWAQETPKSSRQRLRRVDSAATPSRATTSTPTTSSEASTGIEDDDEVVRVNTDLTNILLTAIDKERRFVTSLRREDLRVTENGVAQEISLFQRETELPLSLAILIDASESQKGVLADEKAAALSFLDAVIRADKDQAAIVSFTGIPLLEQPLTNDLGRMRQAIDRVRIILPPERKEDDDESEESSSVTQLDEEDAVGYTGIWDAIWATTNDALSQTPERTRRAIILLSDGDDTSSQTKKQEAIDFAVKHNTVVYSIGIRDAEFPAGKLDRDALRKVSEKTGGRAFFPQNQAELRAAFKQIQDELRSQYLVAYSPTNKLRDGSFRQVRIEVVNPELRKQKLSLLYRQGYYARKPTAKP